MEDKRIAMFHGRRIRKTGFRNEWWFSVIDVVEVLTDSSIPKRYWSDLKKKLEAEGYNEAYEKIVRLKLPAPDGKLRETDCANTETLFRIIQSTKLHRDRDSAGFPALRNDAKDGGAVAGRTRKDIERQTGKRVVSRGNYLDLPKNRRIDAGDGSR